MFVGNFVSCTNDLININKGWDVLLIKGSNNDLLGTCNQRDKIWLKSSKLFIL